MSRFALRLDVFFCFLCVLVLTTPRGYGETFLIEGGGVIEGKLLNPGETPYRIETERGVIVALAPEVVRETIKDDNQALAEYHRTVPLEPDTIENHLRIAADCVEKRLPELAKLHWNRVIELDPNHAEARRKLGYIFDKTTDEWTTTEEKQTRRGYVYHKGHWRTAQDIWISERETAMKQAETEWKKTIKRLSAGVRTYSVREELTSIEDPMAVGPLIDALGKEKNPDVRILYLRALSNIGTPNAIKCIAQSYMDDAVEEVRGTCLDLIKRHPQMIPTAGAYFSTFLTNVDSDGVSRNSMETINRAAYAIGEIGDRSCVGALVSALIVKHKETITIGSDATNVGFSSSGTGYSQGKMTRTTIHTNESAAALEALRRITGQNFRYDRDSWRAWMQDRRKPVPFNARRG